MKISTPVCSLLTGEKNKWLNMKTSSPKPHTTKELSRSSLVRRAGSPSKQDFTIYMLDVGATRYGHSFVIRANDVWIFIDAGHASDFSGQAGYDSIPEQLGKIFGKTEGIEFDLLVITHVHSDHIGCIDELLSSGTIVPKMALVADPNYGFGHAAQDSSPTDSLAPFSSGQKALVAALLEEPLGPEASDAEIQKFIGDAVSLESKYNSVLDSLKKSLGKNLILYDGENAGPVEDAFASIGLKIPGPSKSHLQKCAEGIAKTIAQTASDVASQLQQDSAESMTAIYRQMVSPVTDAADAGYVPGPYAGAKNDTSIVMTIEYEGSKVLLAGDMQFEKPQVLGLDEDMAQLLKGITDGITYDFIQIPHHGSYNATGPNTFQPWANTRNYGMSGGLKDPDHPNKKTLACLKTMLAEHRDLRWGRTDHNGMLTIQLRGSQVQIQVSRGELNDSKVNPKPPPSRPPKATRSSRRSNGDAFVATTQSSDCDTVEVTTLIPHKHTTVNLQIVIAPNDSPVPAVSTGKPGNDIGREPAHPRLKQATSVPTVQIGRGRPLPLLLVVTGRQALAENIGQAEEEAVYKAISDQGWTVVDLPPGTPALAAARLVSPRLSQRFAGVLLLGGYDVVPPFKLDTLDPALRREIETPPVIYDNDNFIVWNDDIYADTDSDTLPEYPVTRIPDGKSAQLVFAMLQANMGGNLGTRFGYRNVLRPFADQVYALISGAAPILQCTPSTPSNVNPASLNCASVYFMLHGASSDGSKFWGNNAATGGEPEAFNTTRIGEAAGGIVFSGACWGALASKVTASQSVPGEAIPTRVAENSIALTFLAKGALAYVGCTGIHYSPLDGTNSFGQPMHQAFWSEIKAGNPPAVALFNAKQTYLAGMPHGQSNKGGRAIEAKLLREFTCLGLGW